jgi:hypothetical protein
MTTEKKLPIRAIKNFRRMTPEVVLTTSTNIHTGVFTNTHFTPPQAPAPPVDAATLKSANDALAAANAAAIDGGKKALAEQKRAKDAVVKLLIELAHYVETNCKDDMTTFLSSGFTAAATTKKKAEPVSDKIRKLHPGPVSGQMAITPVNDPEAVSYVARFAQAPPGGGTPANWTEQPIAHVRPPTIISGLTPATTYIFQIRSLTKTGYGNWSDPVIRVAV